MKVAHKKIMKVGANNMVPQGSFSPTGKLTPSPEKEFPTESVVLEGNRKEGKGGEINERGVGEREWG